MYLHTLLHISSLNLHRDLTQEIGTLSSKSVMITQGQRGIQIQSPRFNTSPRCYQVFSGKWFLQTALTKHKNFYHKPGFLLYHCLSSFFFITLLKLTIRPLLSGTQTSWPFAMTTQHMHSNEQRQAGVELSETWNNKASNSGKIAPKHQLLPGLAEKKAFVVSTCPQKVWGDQDL